MIMHTRYSTAIWGLLFLLPSVGISQVTVTGPTCAIPGTVYQYLISGPWDSVSTMQVCLTGGLMADSNQPCTGNGQPRAFVLVTWDSAGTMTLQVSSSKGNGSITVTVTTPLSGGTIDSAGGSQSVAYDSIAAPVNCAVASGGACSPSYQYQWQQSTDIVTWQNIAGDSSQNLNWSQPLLQTVFVRRQVTETTSGTIAYSNVAVIDVGPPPGAFIIPSRIRQNADMAFIRPILQLKLF